jgi:putative PIN family toxin of toxin-antitoxin system
LRVLLDANVIVSALLSRIGAPARLIGLWLGGAFDIVVCPTLLVEVERALAYPKIRSRVERADADEVLRFLREEAEVVPDPEGQPAVRTDDPGDDYLLALAARENVLLVSGDKHLLALGDEAAVVSPRDFLDALERIQ